MLNPFCSENRCYRGTATCYNEKEESTLSIITIDVVCDCAKIQWKPDFYWIWINQYFENISNWICFILINYLKFFSLSNCIGWYYILGILIDTQGNSWVSSGIPLVQNFLWFDNFSYYNRNLNNIIVPFWFTISKSIARLNMRVNIWIQYIQNISAVGLI